ncbi:MAG: hypothetical protein J6W44_00225, partial [Oscillospiraceae bacterium]|nr:hypothetical protein [Oscillospiraceae bacterium]
MDNTAKIALVLSHNALFPLPSLCLFNGLPFSEIPLILCIPGFLTFRTIAVLLMLGITDEESAAV